MPSLSQAIISNVGAEYIETYFREHKLSRREDQSGMALKYWADTLIVENKLDLSSFEEFLFNELFWGKRKYIRFYQLEKINKVRFLEDWVAIFQENFRLDQLNYCNILGSVPCESGERTVAAIKVVENYKGEIELIQVLFAEYIEISKGDTINQSCTYFPVEIDLKKRMLNIKAWARLGLEDSYKIDAMMNNLVFFIKSVCNMDFRPYAHMHKKALFSMSQDLINQIYTKIPAFNETGGIEESIKHFSQSVLGRLPLKNVAFNETGYTIPKGVLDFDDEIHKVIEKLCVSDYFYDVPYEKTGELTGVDAIISKIRFNDVEHVLTSLSGEDSSVPIFCTKTFMALKKSLEDSEMVERLWIEKSRKRGRLSIAFDATKETYLSVRVLSGIRFTKEDLITVEELYRQYESGITAKTWEKNKTHIV